MQMTSNPQFEKQRRHLQPYLWSELHLLPDRKLLIKKLLDCSAMSLIYGESNSGKTFLALDVALHIVLGLDWQERKTCQGAVVYVAAEGGLGLRERLEAFRIYHQLEAEGYFYLIPACIDLCNPENNTDELIREIKALPDVVLVIVDTLSRAMAGGNENSSDDMGAFIKNCDKIRECTGAHILIVHHAGKDSARGARGHSALRAAVDTEIEVTNDNGIIMAEVKKQRDGKTGEKFYFELKPVSIGQDSDGDEISSCVLLNTDETPRRRKISPQRKRALGFIRDCIIDKGQKRFIRGTMPEMLCITLEEARKALELGNISTSDKPDNVRRSISRIIDDLNNQSITASYNDYIWIPDKKDFNGQTEK
jgi:hypothetical protein